MARRLIVCCDGTWNLGDDRLSNTNVAKIAGLLRQQGTELEQRVYYQRGVGTRRGERLRGGAFVALSHDTRAAYRFLVDTYEPGDHLYLFGFSRGASAVRSLVGLLRSSGLLHRKQAHRAAEAWALYRSRGESPFRLASTLFRRAFAYEPEIDFIGVWDTVGALGVPTIAAPRSLSSAIAVRINRQVAFHDNVLSGNVKGAFHALAIDERRAQYPPALWLKQRGAAGNGQELKQVWFTGTHGDIGGGYAETGLSDITLLWMIDQATRYDLEFHTKAPGFTVRPDVMGPVHESRTGVSLALRPLHRPIGERLREDGFETCEQVSETARQRLDNDPNYRPPGLAGYRAWG
ncbi:DUF2235 domain-containing protein [Streptomyces sp. NPDC047072]|uniref:DUF2235 domain-containing protein n=1 Tax=Streptomyces sp. NPDC047072 TaxID=3154809 RepID=UPI0033F15B29